MKEQVSVQKSKNKTKNKPRRNFGSELSAWHQQDGPHSASGSLTMEGRKEGSKLLASVGAREPWRETRVKPVNTDLGVKNYFVQLTATPRGL